MRTGLTKQEKTTDIWFDEKEPLIYIRTHNTDLKNRLTAPYSAERRWAASEAAKKRIKGVFILPFVKFVVYDL